MALANETTQTKTFCVNHPETETYLRCNKCGKPVCMKCVQRTPVGYRCKDCLGVQRSGYYTATTLDYVIAAVIALVLAPIGSFLMLLVGGGIGFFGIIIGVFAGPIAGGIISEAIRRVISKRRGRYLALVACVAIGVGALALLGITVLPFLRVGGGRAVGGALLNIGFWVFVALTISTTYARLRS